MKVKQQLEQITEQIKGLQSEVDAATKELISGRITYERELVKKTLKDKLTPEKYIALESLIEIEESPRDSESREGSRDKERELYQALSDVRFVEHLKDLAKDQRLLAAEYLVSLRLETGGCGGSFGWFKRPSSCGSCVEGGQLFDALDLWDYLHYRGDRQYGLEESKLDEALSKLS